jgi:STE24 endopeptidase
VNEDRAARYHRLRRRASVLGVAASAAFVALLAFTRWGAVWPLAWFVALIALGSELASFPCDFYGNFLLERKYGLSSQPFRRWLGDHLQAVAIGLAIWELVVFGAYAAMRWTGDAWWLAATAMFAATVLLLSRIGPAVLMPIFEQVRPLEREALRERLLSLSQKAGVPVLGAFEWGLGGHSTRANAALAGLGRSRRILLTDSLLTDYSDDEIEVILAHELAHYVHHDMATALVLESLVFAAAVLTAHLVVTAVGYAPADRPALPLMLLAAGAALLLLMPIGKAWSRRSERRADRYALALTGRQDAFVSAMRRLGAQNLAEPDPSRPALWFFHTHPTIDERIAAARDFTAA